jgi:hypothetical protein
MRPIGPDWKQGAVRCFDSRSVIPRSVAFRNAVRIYSIRTSFRLFVTTVLLLS